MIPANKTKIPIYAIESHSSIGPACPGGFPGIPGVRGPTGPTGRIGQKIPPQMLTKLARSTQMWGIRYNKKSKWNGSTQKSWVRHNKRSMFSSQCRRKS